MACACYSRASLVVIPSYMMRELPLHAQVLDGTSVEAGEQASSRSQYAGRLTLDSLLERIAPARLESLRELDLTDMGLKDLADVLIKEEQSLSALQSLRLDQNELTEVCKLKL